MNGVSTPWNYLFFAIHHDKFRNNFHIKFQKVEHKSVFFNANFLTTIDFFIHHTRLSLAQWEVKLVKNIIINIFSRLTWIDCLEAISEALCCLFYCSYGMYCNKDLSVLTLLSAFWLSKKSFLLGFKLHCLTFSKNTSSEVCFWYTAA